MTTTETGAPARTTDPPPPAAPVPSAPWWRLAGPGLVIGAVSALYRLDHRGLWLDEAYTLGAVHQLKSSVPETSWTMSGYYAVLRVWFWVSESVWWMRLPSVVAALGALAVTVVVARRLAGAREACLAGILLALSPMWLTYAQEARSYGFVMLLVAGSWLALDHGLDPDVPARHRRWWWLLHSVIALALPLLHGLTVLQMVPQLAVVGLARADRGTWLRALRGVGLCVLITATLARTASDDVGNWVEPITINSMNFTMERFLSRWVFVCLALVVVLLVGVAVSIATARRAPTAIARARALAPVVWGLGGLALLVLLSLARPSLVPRYAVGCVPGLALLMAAAVERAGRVRGRAPALRTVAAVVLALALAAGHVYLHTRPVDGWTVAARRIAAEAQPGDTILLSREPTTRPPFEAAWRDVDPVNDPVLIPADRPLGEVLRFEPDDTDATERWNQARAAGRIWVVADGVRRELDRLEELTVDGVAGRPASHREVARWRARRSTIYVVLLEPIAR
ncbi:MAG TPA: glycosyltransferase family 39 protein [Iamia sp.]